MARGPDIAGAATQSKGLRPGLKFYSPFPFAGMNVQASNIAIDDKEFSYVENFVRIGDGNLRTVWDVGTPIYRAPQGLSIVSFFWYTIATSQYVAVFLSDGSAVQVAYPSGAPIQIGGQAKFFAKGGALPACTQYGVLYLLIANNNTVNDYWAWDGALLYTSGTAAPNGVTLTSSGQNYTSEPQVTAFGGHGSGLTFKTTFNAGEVVNVQIKSPGIGYETGDVVQAQFSGGGSDTGPILTASLTAGQVAAANVTAEGSGYTHASISFSGGSGTGATANAVIGTGVASVNVTNQGANYTNATVSFSGGGGSGAVATVLIVGGAITEIDVVNPGSGYSSAPAVTITGDGTGATATASINGNGIISIVITNGGTGYTSAPSISISGDGTGATAVAVLGGTQLQSINVINPGSGFIYSPPLTFTGGGGVGASGWVTIGPTSVQRADVLTAGMDYQQIPNLDIIGGPADIGAAQISITMNGAGGVGQLTVINAGSGYGIEPELLFVTKKGDTGSGATGRVILAPHAIHQGFLSNFGLNYTDAPAIVVGGGANHSAYATIEMMPFGLSGAVLETFQSRVWLGNPAPSPFDTIPPQGDFSVTAAGSITDVSNAAGGVLFTNSDRFLQTKYVAFRQSNGYLYALGDGSCNVVSNVQTTTSNVANVPTVQTTFNYQNVDPQVGCSWRDTVQDFGRTILFGNETGIYGLYGGAATKVSGKLDQLFTQALFPPDGRAVTPSSAVAHIYNVKHYLMLLTIFDPETGLPHNVMATWNEREWTLTSQGPNLTYIGSQKLGSEYRAWGTDGAALYPLFASPSATLKKRLWTKLYGAPQSYMIKEGVGFYLQATDNSPGRSGIAANVNFNVAGLALQDPEDASTPSGVYTNMLIVQPNFPAPPPQMAIWGAGTVGLYFACAGAQLATTSPDFTLGNLLISYTDNTAFGG